MKQPHKKTYFFRANGANTQTDCSGVLYGDIGAAFFIKLLLVYLCITAFVLLALLLFFKNFPMVDLSPQAITDIPESLRIYDSDDELALTASGSQRRIFIELSQLPPHVKNAFVAAEDARFYSHNGIDLRRIFAAAAADIKSGSYKQGGSTITQQLIKNSHLSGTKKLSRKIQEALLACQLEARFSKEEIMQMYLNYVYFGNGAYGIEAAARTYFDKSASELTLAESAALAATVKAPSIYSPAHPNACTSRRNTVLRLMYKNGLIDLAALNFALKAPLETVPCSYFDYNYGYYADCALQSAAALTSLSADELLSGGYSIYTTLDSGLADTLGGLLKEDSLFPTVQTECAAVCLDSKTGAVLALEGGRSYCARLCFNRAVSARRRPGSVIKPLLVYAPALETGKITAASVFIDEKKDFDGYSPNNFHDKYYGAVTARTALVKSLNVPAVEILSSCGIDVAKSYARLLGITFDPADNGLALALGGFTYGISPMEAASAYQCLAAGGLRTSPYFVRKVTSADGTVLYNRTAGEQKRVFSPQTAYIISDILKDAAKKPGSPLSALNGVSAKTGTASRNADTNSDIWVAAYDSRLTVAIWQGCDTTNDAHCLPGSATGSKYPSAMAARLFEFSRSRSAPEPGRVPDGIVRATLDARALLRGSLELATDLTPKENRITELFTNDTRPQKYSSYYRAPEACDICALHGENGNTVSITARNSYTLYRIYRTENGNHRLIGVLRGKSGETLSLLDHADVSARYYAVSEHAEITAADGSPLLGKASRLVRAE